MASSTTTFAHETAVAGELEVLLVRLGARLLGVPLSQVRYIAPLPSDYVAFGAGVSEHFVFEGTPLAFVSLWDTLNLPSQYAEFGELQTMLPLRRQDHLDWMAALENSLRTGVPFAKARNPRECAFGKWYYGHRSDDRRLALILGQFEQPHATIHALADSLLGLAEAGARDEALHKFEEARDSTLAMLMRLFDSALMLVTELQRRVAVIVAAGGETCALGADGVRDIVAVPADRVKHGRHDAARATSDLVILDDRSVVPMLNWRAFRG